MQMSASLLIFSWLRPWMNVHVFVIWHVRFNVKQDTVIPTTTVIGNVGNVKAYTG